MPKIQIDIPNDVYQKLKLHAEDDDRSLTKYITRGMKYLADIPNGYHNAHNTSNNPNIIDLSALPENTTIKTTRSQASTKPKYPARNLIKEAQDNDIFNSPSLRIHHNDDDPFTDEEYQDEINEAYKYAYTHPDFATLKSYYDSFTSSIEERSEARERLVGIALDYGARGYEAFYLEQAFDFVPPGDEPTLSLSEYLHQLVLGYYTEPEDQIPHLIIKETGR